MVLPFNALSVPGLKTSHGKLGLALVILGEALILIRLRPLSDFYFPVIWLGYILFLDGVVFEQTRWSPYQSARPLFLALFPVSSLFWWIFELFNQFVHNWIYVGGQGYQGFGFLAIASIDFSTVLPAVFTSALFVNALLPKLKTQTSRPTTQHSQPVTQNSKLTTQNSRVPNLILALEFLAGLLCLALPIVFPRYAFGMVWGSTCLLIDPINHLLGRPSIIGFVYHRQLRVPLVFALGALMCGFFWESWNYWSLPKWTYSIPYVNYLHIFEMPLPGYVGYLPFGLELFAMANFVLPFFRLPPLLLYSGNVEAEALPSSRAAS